MQRSGSLLVVWVLSLAVRVIKGNANVNGVCQQNASSPFCHNSLDFSDGNLQIVDCTPYVANATFTSVQSQRVLNDVEVYPFYWICESESGEDYKQCNTGNRNIGLTNNLDISLNVSGNGQLGSMCYIEVCVVQDFDYDNPRRIRSNECVIPGEIASTTATGIAPTTAAEIAPTTAAEITPTTAAEITPTTASEIAPTTAAEITEIAPTTTFELKTSTTATEIAPTTAAEIAPTTAAEIAPTTAFELITSTAGGKQVKSTMESTSDVQTSVPGINEVTQRSHILAISIISSVMVLVLILVVMTSMVLIMVTQLRMRKLYHNSWLSCGKPELPFDPHYTPVDIESPSFISTNRTSLLSMDNMFQNLCLDPPKGSLYIDKVLTHKSLLDISGSHSDLCVTLNAADRELNKDVESASINMGKDSIGSMSCDVSKPCVPLNDESLRAFSNAMNISLLKSDSSSYLPSNTSYVQQNKPDLQLLPSKGDVDFDDHDDLLSPRTDIIDFPGEPDCYHPFSLCHGFDHEVQSCESTGTQNFTFELDNSSSPEDDLMLVPDLPHPISGQSAAWKDEAVQLDSHYVSSESGYVQSHNMQVSTDNTECLFDEGDEHLDTDLFTSNELTEENGEQLLAVGQSLGPPTCLFDIEDTPPSVNMETCDTEQASDTDEEVDILTLHEPNICYQDHNDYITEECPLPETSPLPYTPKSDSIGYVPEDLSSQSNILPLNYPSSDVSSEYIVSGVSSGSKQQIPMDMFLLRRLNDVEEEIGGFDLTFSFDEQ